MANILTRALNRFAPVSAMLAADAPASPALWGDSSHLGIIKELYGIADASGIAVTRGNALALPVISKARRVLATNLGRMTLVNRKGGRPAPLQMPYLEQPEAERPLSATLTWTADALMFYPRTWWIVQRRDAAGWPARGGVKLLDRADATFDRDGKLIKAWGKPVEARDVIQFDSPDGGLLSDSAPLLRRALVLNRAAALAEENPVPALDLHNVGDKPLSSDQIGELLESFMEARRRRSVAYSDKSIEVKPLGMVESQLLLGARTAMDLDLARVVGLPAWAADVAVQGSSLRYENRSARSWELIDLFLSTYMTAIASRLSMGDATPQGWRTEFSTDDLTRDDIKTRFETYAIGIEKNFIDQAWIEAQEGQTMKGTAA